MRFAASLLVVVVAACAPQPRMTMPRATANIAIGTVTLGLSNVHVLFGEHVVLVDTGSPGELDALEAGLRELGVRLADVSCAVVTHVHSDHAGTARALQRRGIKIIAGQRDLDRAIAGDRGTLHPTGFFARFILLPLIPIHLDAFWPDVRVRDRYDLRACGVDADVVAMPGHTAGSLVVIAGGGKVALVGDLFRGGTFAGYVHREQPVEHFYQDDLELVHARIRELVARGVEYYFMGHGGPSRRADVAAVFAR